MTGPNIIGLLNGLISMVSLGLTECYAGFGDRTTHRCENFESIYDLRNGEYTRGKLSFTPSNSSSGATVVDELAMLLTAGRLNSSSRDVIINAYDSASSAALGLKMAQKLIAATPEFHSTDIFDSKIESRPEIETPESSGGRYKAVSRRLHTTILSIPVSFLICITFLPIRLCL